MERHWEAGRMAWIFLFFFFCTGMVVYVRRSEYIELCNGERNTRSALLCFALLASLCFT